MSKLAGRVALVTGAGRGIGRAIALKLASEGAHLVINDFDEEPALETLAELRSQGAEAVGCNGDVAAPEFGERFVRTALDTFGALDIIVNNAGYTWDNVIQKMTDEQLDKMLDVHLKGPFRILRAAIPAIREFAKKEAEAGKRVHRKIVNISSMVGLYGNAGQANYASAKAAIVGLTRSLAKEWGRYNVNVNAVAFGWIDTRLTKPIDPDNQANVAVGGESIRIGANAGALEAFRQLIPLGRPGTPAEAAGAVYLLCTPEADYISGQVLVAGGGLLM